MVIKCTLGEILDSPTITMWNQFCVGNSLLDLMIDGDRKEILEITPEEARLFGLLERN